MCRSWEGGKEGKLFQAEEKAEQKIWERVGPMMYVSNEKLRLSRVMKNEAASVDQSPAVKVTGAIKTFGLHSVDQRSQS